MPHDQTDLIYILLHCNVRTAYTNYNVKVVQTNNIYYFIRPRII